MKMDVRAIQEMSKQCVAHESDDPTVHKSSQFQ